MQAKNNICTRQTNAEKYARNIQNMQIVSWKACSLCRICKNTMKEKIQSNMRENTSLIRIENTVHAKIVQEHMHKVCTKICYHVNSYAQNALHKRYVQIKNAHGIMHKSMYLWRKICSYYAAKYETKYGESQIQPQTSIQIHMQNEIQYIQNIHKYEQKICTKRQNVQNKQARKYAK